MTVTAGTPSPGPVSNTSLGSLWAGDYSLNVQWWNDYFSPLLINDDGSAVLAGTLLSGMTFDGSSNTLTFPWNNFLVAGKATRASGQLSFAGSQPNVSVSGSIRPRPQDGPLPATGAEITSVNVGALSNLVPAGELIEPGDVVSIEDYTGANLGADSSSRLATTTGNALSFTIEPNGDGLAFKSSHGYLTVDPNGVLMVNGASPGTAFFIEITAAGGVLIADGTGAYWSWSNDGSISMTQQSVIQLGTQFQMRVQPVSQEDLLARWGIDTDTDTAWTKCDWAVAGLEWQMTGGLFAALGLGPFFISGKTQTGWIAFVMKFPVIQQLVADAAAAIKAAPAVAAAAAANVLLEIYRQGLLWKFVKFLLAQLGWWVLFRIVAKIIEVFLIPEAAMVELVASFVVWIAATVSSAVTAYQTCNPSLPAGPVTATA